MLVTVFLIAVILTALLVKRYKRQRLFDGIPQPEGKLPILGHSRTFLQLKKPVDVNLYKLLMKLANEHHDAGMCYFSVGPVIDILWVTKPEFIEQILR